MASGLPKWLFGRNPVLLALEHKPVQVAFVVKPVILLYISSLDFFAGFVFGMQVRIPCIPVVVTGAEHDQKKQRCQNSFHDG
jgi:hypothetical protein